MMAEHSQYIGPILKSLILSEKTEKYAKMEEFLLFGRLPVKFSGFEDLWLTSFKLLEGHVDINTLLENHTEKISSEYRHRQVILVSEAGEPAFFFTSGYYLQEPENKLETLFSASMVLYRGLEANWKMVRNDNAEVGGQLLDKLGQQKEAERRSFLYAKETSKGIYQLESIANQPLSENLPVEILLENNGI